MAGNNDEQFSEKEAQACFEAALGGGLQRLSIGLWSPMDSLRFTGCLWALWKA
jgi:hypothetical protein